MAVTVDRPDTGESSPSYIIIGAGVFGASTALHLKQTKPRARVILIDRLQPNPAAASFDLNKIIRADYCDVFYMKLSLEAQRLWQNDPLYKPYFHQTGMLFAENLDKGQSFLANYAALGVSTPATLMTVDQARQDFPTYANANWQGVEQAYFNPDSGWGDSEPALRAVVNAAIASGVEFRLGTVEKLLFRRLNSANDKKFQSPMQCTGVRLCGGIDIQANHILLCTGAATAKLLADSAPTEAKFQSGDRLAAAAALSCTVRVDPEKWHVFRDAPVFANLMSHTTGKY
jgi:sarcosine oxidase/L-pipecolate oxidase